MADRTDFLIEMYNQLCSEIDRHIKVTWQIVGVLLSTFAVFALIEKNIISLDIATSIVIAVCALAIGIIIESNFWYNRNLVIIANIERQFLVDTDIEDIHYYFKSHRKNNAYLDMMLIQLFFILIISSIVVLYHFSKEVLPSLSPSNEFNLSKTIPYLVLIASGILLLLFHFKRRKNYNEFKKNSPGKMIGGNAIASNSDHVI